MLIGIPKEIENHDYRVGLTPESVAELVAHGHELVVETSAGGGIGTTGHIQSVYFRDPDSSLLEFSNYVD